MDYAKTVSGTKVLRNLMNENKIELYKLYVSAQMSTLPVLLGLIFDLLIGPSNRLLVEGLSYSRSMNRLP